MSEQDTENMTQDESTSSLESPEIVADKLSDDVPLEGELAPEADVSEGTSEPTGPEEYDDALQANEDDDEELDDNSSFQLAAGGQPPLDELPLTSKIEAMVFASPKCIKPQEILELLDDESLTIESIEHALQDLSRYYRERSGGFTLEHIKGHGYQFRTVQAAGRLMERMFASRPRPISRAALETLAIVAYRQPVTRADVEFIRGVDSGSIVKNLLDRDLIKCVGRKEDAGRPMLFGTTNEFLNVFRLSSLDDLPPLSAFQPNQETMREALKQFEDNATDTEGTIEVSNGDFVGDDNDNHPPQVSQGLIGDKEPPREELEDASNLMVDGLTQDDSATANKAATDEPDPRIEGATALVSDSALQEHPDEEANNDHERSDQTKQMAVPDGDHLPEDRRDMDSRGPHRD